MTEAHVCEHLPKVAKVAYLCYNLNPITIAVSGVACDGSFQGGKCPETAVYRGRAIIIDSGSLDTAGWSLRPPREPSTVDHAVQCVRQSLIIIIITVAYAEGSPGRGPPNS